MFPALVNGYVLTEYGFKPGWMLRNYGAAGSRALSKHEAILSFSVLFSRATEPQN
jgi:hypothetical protein